MRVKLNPSQRKLFLADNKYVACVAGYGSGKTFVLILKMLYDYFSNPGANLCYFAPGYQLCFDIAYPMLEEFLTNTKTPYHSNKQARYISVPGYGIIYFRSALKPETMIGFSILSAYGDEVDLLPYELAEKVIDKMMARMRQRIEGAKNQLYLISTPEGYKYMYHNFEKEPLEDSTLIRMSTYDNIANLPDDFIPTLIKKYPKSLIDAYLLGKFVNINKLGVWAEFDREKNRMSVDSISSVNPIHVGMDFNVGKGCAVIFDIRQPSSDAEKVAVAIDEIINTFDTNETISVIKERYPGKSVIVYPDASGSARKTINASISDLSLLRDAGFTVRANRANPSVKDRVIATNTMFCNGEGERRLFVDVARCPNLTEALEQQVYDDNGLPSKDGKYDHVTDAFSYPIAYLFPVHKLRAGIAKVQGT